MILSRYFFTDIISLGQEGVKHKRIRRAKKHPVSLDKFKPTEYKNVNCFTCRKRFFNLARLFNRI